MLSVSTVVFDGHDMAAGFDLLASLGVTAVEPAFIKGYVAFDESAFRPKAAAAIGALLATSGLSAAALSAHIDLGEADSADRLLARADFAARIGAPVLVTNATSTDLRGAFDATLSRCLPEFAARSLILAIENPGHGSGSLIPNGRAAAALIGSIGHPSLRLNYDIANARTYGQRPGTAAEDLAASLPVTTHLHLKDVTEDGNDWHFCAIGDGVLDYAELLPPLAPRALSIGIELPLRLSRPGRGDPVRALSAVPMADLRASLARSVGFAQHLLGV